MDGGVCEKHGDVGRPDVVVCGWCGSEVVVAARGRVPRWCGSVGVSASGVGAASGGGTGVAIGFPGAGFGGADGSGVAGVAGRTQQAAGHRPR